MQFFCQNQANLIISDINTFTTDGKKTPLQGCKKCLQNGATFVAGATNVAGFISPFSRQPLDKIF
jgi:hypothetical protein